MSDESKSSSFYQILITLLFTLGAIVIAMGISDDSTAKTLETFAIAFDVPKHYTAIMNIVEDLRDRSSLLFILGIIMITSGLAVSAVVFRVKKD